MLKEKISQMLIIGFKGTDLNASNTIIHTLLAHPVGGVILFDHNIKSPKQLKHLTEQLQAYAHSVPLFIGIDYEGGRVNRLKESNGFPPTLSAADIGRLSFEEATSYAQQMASTLKENGVNLNFAPVVDVNVNPDNPIIGKFGRSFSEDPQKVIAYAKIFSKAYYDYGLYYAYKHFPGHGSATADSHLGFVDATDSWQPYELTPYQTLLSTSPGHPLVMTSHVIHKGLDAQGYPASLSAAITQGVLREKLGFNGVVVTDDLQMKAITNYYGLENAILLAINAGADLLIFGNQLVSTPQDPALLIDLIEKAVYEGKISENRIHEAYKRIIKLKNYRSLLKP